MIKIKWNIAASLAAQFIATTLSFYVVPLYLAGLGNEEYGLVAAMAVVATLCMVGEMGLTSALARKVAESVSIGDQKSIESHRSVVEVAMIAVGCILVSSAWLLAPEIGASWLSSDGLGERPVECALLFTAGTVGLRLVATARRAVMVGSDRWIEVNIVTVASAVIRVCLGLGAIHSFANSLHAFFISQLIAATADLAIVYAFCPGRICLSAIQPSSLLRLWRLALPMFGLNILWLIAANGDKIVLASQLSLREYGSVSVGLMLASGVHLIAIPFAQAVQSRICLLHSLGEKVEFLRIYRLSTVILSSGVSAIALTLCTFALPLLTVWTDRATAELAAPALSIYALGNAVAGILMLSFALQFAAHRLVPHLVANSIIIAVMIPGYWFLGRVWGAVGTGAVWLSCNLVMLIGWSALVHRRMLPGLGLVPFYSDWMFPMLVSGGSVYILRTFVPVPSNTGLFVSWLCFVTCLSGTGGIAASPIGRSALVKYRSWLI